MKRKFIFILMVFVILLTFSVISNATCEIIRIDVKNGKSEKIEINVDKEINKTSEFIKTPTPRNIFGEDTRYKVIDTTVYPYSTIGRIDFLYPYDNTTNYGTMTMIGDNIAITAAHCVYDDTLGGLFQNLTVRPGFYAGNNPFGYCGVETIYIAQEYLDTHASTDQSIINESYNYDWAILVLSENLGNNSGWLSVVRTDNYLELFNKNIRIIGYPKYVLGINTYTNWLYQYMDYGVIDSAYSARVEYTLDTSTGQSGAPILNLANDVIGVHGGTIYGGQSNRGIWITQYVFNNVLEAINNN